MTLGNAAAARVRLIVWCKDCRHQIEPDAAEMAQRYGAETPVFDWSARLVCSRCPLRQPSNRYGRDRQAAAPRLTPQVGAGGVAARHSGAAPSCRDARYCYRDTNKRFGLNPTFATRP